MINGKKVLAVVVARGGSKGLPRKNILPCHGRPLIEWTLLAAKASQLLDRTVVSTDDEEIADIALNAGGDVPFLRTPAAASDEAPGVAGVLDMLERIKDEFDIAIMLQPTSPLRTSEDIDNAIRLCVDRNAPSVISVTDVTKEVRWSLNLSPTGEMERVFREDEYVLCRQQIPKRAYAPNGAVYVAQVGWLRENRSFMSDGVQGYIMPQDRSIDIDSQFEFSLAEHFLAVRHADT